jgi:hypothetical protein
MDKNVDSKIEIDKMVVTDTNPQRNIEDIGVDIY